MIWFSNSRNCQKISPCFQCYWLEAERLLHSRLRCQPIFQACMYGLGRWRKKRLKPLMIGVLAVALIHHRRPRSRFFWWKSPNRLEVGNRCVICRFRSPLWSQFFRLSYPDGCIPSQPDVVSHTIWSALPKTPDQAGMAFGTRWFRQLILINAISFVPVRINTFKVLSGGLHG